MFGRNCLKALGLICLALFFVGCSNTEVGYIQISPATQSLAGGQTVQFVATGIVGHGSHPASSQDVTNQVTWASSTPAVATVSPSGLATAVSAGTVTISANMTGSTGATATLTVTSASGGTGGGALASLSIIPGSQSVASPGQTSQFIAVGSTVSGATRNLTATATWFSSSPQVATISLGGLVTGLSKGTTTITAIATNPDGSVVTASGTFTVIGASGAAPQPIASVSIIPSSQSVASPGQTGKFIAIGTSGSTGLQSDITSLVTWISSSEAVATVNANGLATAVSQGTTAITAVAKNPDGTVVTTAGSFTVTGVASPQPIASVAVIPGTQSVALPGGTGQFVAIGTSGSTGLQTNITSKVTWSSSNEGVATISASGLATGVSQGTTVILAIAKNPDETVVTGTAILTVNISATPEPLQSLAIVPASQAVTTLDQPAQFIVIGTTSSGATVNLTNMPAMIGTKTIEAAKWKSSSNSVATINPATGLAKAVANGTTAITAIASNPDGTVVTGTAILTVNISATPKPLQSLAIVPASQAVATAGETAKFLAIGTFLENSSTPGTHNMADVTGYTVSWTSSNPQVASIGATNGLAKAVGQGTTAITAIATNTLDQSASYATATLTVTGTSTQQITSLAIIPNSQTVTLPLPLATPAVPTTYFVAIGTNGSTGFQQNLTNAVSWTPSNTAVATIDNSGAVTMVGQGTTTITAQYNNLSTTTSVNAVTATATLTVNGVASEPLLSLTLVPGAESVAYPGQTSQLIAIGTFSAAPITQNLTTSITYPVTWTSSNTAVATVCTAGSPAPCTPATDGLVTAVGQGTAAITAIATNPDNSVVTGVSSFTVVNGSSEQITALSIIPGSLSLSATGQPGQFIALGTAGATGLQEDVTNSPQLAWSSSIPTYATVTTGLPGVGNGEAQGVSAGSTNITAKWTNPATSTTPTNVVTAQATVSVSTTPAAEPLLSIVVLPASITDLNLMGTGQFLAYGTFSTAPTVLEVTNGFSHVGFPVGCTTNCPWNPVNWISTAPFDFPINSAGAKGASGGLATADSSGTAVIYAVATNPDNTLVYSPVSTFNCPYAPPTYGTTTVTDPNTGVTTTTTNFNDLLNPGTCNAITVADSLLSTLTVFNASSTSTGLNQAGWLITAPSATGTPDVIHCGGTIEQATPQGSVCEATYPNGTILTLTAPAEPGVNFGGWSSNCTAQGAVTAAGPNSCTVIVGGGCVLNPTTQTYTCVNSSNLSVGAVFN